MSRPKKKGSPEIILKFRDKFLEPETLRWGTNLSFDHYASLVSRLHQLGKLLPQYRVKNWRPGNLQGKREDKKCL